MKEKIEKALVILGLALIVGIPAFFAIGSIYLFWDDTVSEPQLRSEVWEGTITRKYRSPWWSLERLLDDGEIPAEGYYWDVETVDGSTISVEVLDSQWEWSKVGDIAYKVEGERYPDFYDPKHPPWNKSLDRFDIHPGEYGPILKEQQLLKKQQFSD